MPRNELRKTICALFLFVAIAASGCQQHASSGASAKIRVASETTESGEACHTTPNREQLAKDDFKTFDSSVAAASDEANGSTANMVLIRGGTFTMGSDRGMPAETPAHAVTVKPFYIDRTEVTVAEFAKFVAATGYKTEAEKFGESGVFDLQTGRWTMKPGANWRTPEGGDSTAAPDEPVCQVSWNDAQAFAKWAGKRLPSEAEWEFAARGGLKNKEYAWGDELMPNGKFAANYWQGEFPIKNTGADGFTTRAPIKSFAPNNYGLYDVAGNVWEWCADWYAADYYRASPRTNPRGASAGEERVMRGGSWMCAGNYCTNYRVAGRSSSTPDTGLNNTGFRLARNAETLKFDY